jgi:hypothetical protein
MKMNTKNLIAALAVLTATGSAFAAEWNDFSDFQSTKTRAEVASELKDAQAKGNYVVGGKEFVAPDAGFASTKTREQVAAELKQSEADGSYALLHQEFEGQVPAAGVTAARLARSGKAANLN